MERAGEWLAQMHFKNQKWLLRHCMCVCVCVHENMIYDVILIYL